MIRKNDEYLKTLSDDQIDNLKKEEEEYIKILDNQYGDDSDWDSLVCSKQIYWGLSPYFYKKADLEKAVYF